MSIFHRLSLVAAAAVALSCSSSSTAPAAVVDTFGGSPTALSVDVQMTNDNRYAPNNVDIAVGGAVRFVFPANPHDVRFSGAANAPADIFATSNVTVARTFTVKGTYAFVCTLHDNMSGKVIVN